MVSATIKGNIECPLNEQIDHAREDGVIIVAIETMKEIAETKKMDLWQKTTSVGVYLREY
jgi:hypothetical protein